MMSWISKRMAFIDLSDEVEVGTLLDTRRLTKRNKRVLPRPNR